MRLVLIAIVMLGLTQFVFAAGTIQPPAAMAVQGAPEIPAALAAEVRRYTESRSAGLCSWHPAKKEMLIATRFGDTTQIHRVKTPGGARTQLTFFEEPVGGATYDRKDGLFFIFTRDNGGDEFDQLYRYDLADGRVALLTDGGRSQNGGVVWSTAGDHIAYESTRRNGEDRDIYVMDPRDPKTDRLALKCKGGGWHVEDWSPDNKRLLLLEYLSINESRLWLLDLASGDKTLLTPDKTPAAYASPKFAADGNSLFLVTDRDDEFRRLSKMDLETRSVTPLVTTIPWDITSLALSDDGGLLAFVANEAGIDRLFLMNTASGKAAPLPAVPTGLIGGLAWHRNGRDLGFTLASARSTGDAWSLDVTTNELTRWTESELGGMAAGELSEPALIQWKSFDGREITGFYYAPPARFKGKRPVIIQIHGGPEGQSVPGFMGRSNYYLNELGVALILPNVRGSSGFGKSFLKLDNGMKREDSVKDIGALLDWIAAHPGLDAARVMVMGGSYGGYMTLAVSMHYADRIRCAFDTVGISNFNTFLKNTESYRRELRRAEYGDEREPAMREFFQRISPLSHVDKIRKPLLIAAGGNDPRVPASESGQMAEKLRAAGTPVWYVLAKDEGHGFKKKPNADYLFYTSVAFIRNYLIERD